MIESYHCVKCSAQLWGDPLCEECGYPVGPDLPKIPGLPYPYDIDFYEEEKMLWEMLNE